MCAVGGGHCVIFLDPVSMIPFHDVLNTGQHNTQTFRQNHSSSGCLGGIRLSGVLPLISIWDWLKQCIVDLISWLGSVRLVSMDNHPLILGVAKITIVVNTAAAVGGHFSRTQVGFKLNRNKAVFNIAINWHLCCNLFQFHNKYYQTQFQHFFHSFFVVVALVLVFVSMSVCMYINRFRAEILDMSCHGINSFYIFR